jgi:hypothetical protein
MNISISTGARFFSLNTYMYRDNNKVINSRYNSRGPVGEIKLDMNNSLRTRLFGWYEFIRLEDKQNREQVNMNLDVEWRF